MALGSSYAAGPGIDPVVDLPCVRSGKNYAHLVAAARNLELTDVSCSGATTSALSTGTAGMSQIEAVHEDTRLVTITVGGNDLDYIGAMGRASHINTLRTLLAGSAGSSSVSETIDGRMPEPSQAAYAQVRDALVDTVEAVHRVAPNAVVAMVGYLPVLDSGVLAVDPKPLCPDVPLTVDQARTLRHVFEGLRFATADAARLSGALLIPIPDAAEHAACGIRPWVNGFRSGGLLGGYHPTELGMRAVADAILEYI
ncbi:SGNH/GDSL hydrolase family protein [Nocardia sp. JMUB6875]|uniref:SGNH/GDSL hydrolase family protein n=1 Tax=Nocardia sp. JMUB6875 TaxID=3158170 RepID=UPI0034E84FA6